MNVPFINLADTQCWMIYLLPFDSEDRKNYEKVKSFQDLCINKKIFGMGWSSEGFEQFFLKNIEISEQNATLFLEKTKIFYKEKRWELAENSLRNALKNYCQINPGDYVMTKLKNGHYIIGRVATKIAYIYDKSDECLNKLSWGGFVDEWIEFNNDREIPSELVGRLSSRYNKTIEINNWYRQNLLMISCYEKNASVKNSMFEEIPKLLLNKSNFVRSCDYRELEDIVSIFINNQHSQEGYYLLPSSCKISQQNYEFLFVAKGKKPITCQVKNQSEDINLELYARETSYARIYVFSGEWSDEQVDILNNEYQNRNHSIYIIKPSELYKTLTSVELSNANYIDTDNKIRKKEEFNFSNMKKVGQFRGIKKNAYKDNDDYICFIKDWFFYSFEFDALILKYHLTDDAALEKECVDYVKEYLDSI